MVLPLREGTSGQNGIINNTPLAREDNHLLSNAAALVTGASLLTFPLDVVAPNSGTENVTSLKSKQLAENDLFMRDDFGKVVKNLEKVWSYHAVFHTNAKSFPGH